MLSTFLTMGKEVFYEEEEEDSLLNCCVSTYWLAMFDVDFISITWFLVIHKRMCL